MTGAEKKKEKGYWGAWGVLCAAFLMLVFFNLFYLENWIDSDMAAEMIFSRLLAQEGKVFATENWYYSTEFRVLYTQLIMEPLFFLFQDWHVIRGITNILTYILLLCSYFYMIRPLRVKRTTGLLSAVLLLLPFSETLVTHVQMGNTYMPHMIIICFGFGMFLRLSAGEKSGSGKVGRLGKAALVIGYLLLSLVCGLSGVRYLLALQAPLVLTGLVYSVSSREFADFRRDFDPEHFKRLLSQERGRYLVWGILGAAGAMAGYALNVLFVASKFTFQTYEATNFVSVYQGIWLQRVQDTLGSLLMLFGYIPDKGFLSLRGLVTMAAFVMLAGILFITVRTGRLLRKKEEESEGCCHRRFLLYFFITAFLLNTFVFMFTTGTLVPRYYLTVFLFVPALLAVYYEEERLPLDRALVMLVLCCCILLATAKTVFSFMSTDKNQEKRGVAAFLEEEDYEFGYATYWNANIITELTNGAVEVANINKPDRLDYFYWSSPKRYYEEGYHTGKTFLLLTTQEQEEYGDRPVILEGREVYRDAYYVVYHFDSEEAFQQYREDQIK